MSSTLQPSSDGPASMVKALPTLGHAVVEWWEHGLAIVKQLTKHPERNPALVQLVTEAVNACGGTPSPLLSSTDLSLELEISCGADDDWWITRVSPATKEQYLLQCWLLQLPALRPEWEKRIRSTRLHLLQRRVAGAWWPRGAGILPPGAVISGLGVTSWETAAGLPQVARDATGMMFEIKPIGSQHSVRYQRTAAGRVEKV